MMWKYYEQLSQKDQHSNGTITPFCVTVKLDPTFPGLYHISVTDFDDEAYNNSRSMSCVDVGELTPIMVHEHDCPVEKLSERFINVFGSSDASNADTRPVSELESATSK